MKRLHRRGGDPERGLEDFIELHFIESPPILGPITIWAPEPGCTDTSTRRMCVPSPASHTQPTPSSPAEGRPRPVRPAPQAAPRRWWFGLIAVVVLGVGGFLGFGDFWSRPVASGANGQVISVQSSMAGFTPAEIRVRAGSTVTLEWWTDDSALHLQGGVHTMIAPELGLSETLPAESRRQVTWTVPDKPGRYDVYCDSCCGGKASPSMHGTIVIDPA